MIGINSVSLPQLKWFSLHSIDNIISIVNNDCNGFEEKTWTSAALISFLELEGSMLLASVCILL